MEVLPAFRAWLNRLDERELALVRPIVALARRAGLLRLTRIVSRLGNGWLYLLLAGSSWILRGAETHWALGWSSLASLLAFPVYWVVKRTCARHRPHHRDPTLDTGLPTLDRYSFPSGHAMTATTVGIPFGLTLPYAFFPFIAGWLLIAFSRIAAGHHYPSDILAGALLGGGTSFTALVLLS